MYTPRGGNRAANTQEARSRLNPDPTAARDEAAANSDEDATTTASEPDTGYQNGPAVASPKQIDDKIAKDEPKWTDAAMMPKSSWGEEVWATVLIGSPLAVSGLAKSFQHMAIATVLGRADTKILAAVSVAAVWTNLTEVMLGSATGQVMALCSQAYGAKNYRLVATWVHISLVFATLLAIPFASLRWFTTDVLLFLGVEPEIAEMSGQYTVHAQSVLIFDLWYHTFRVYFASQAIVVPSAVNDVIFIFVAFLNVYMACFVFNGGIVAAAIASAATWALRTIVFVVGSFAMGYHKKTWYTPEFKEIFVWSRWKLFLSMVIPAAIAGVAEQAQVQASMLISAQNGVTVAAGHALVGNMVMFSFMFAFSASGATGIRVARFLGEGNPKAAKFAAWAGVTLVGCCNGLFGILFSLLLPTYTRIATTDPLVWEQVDRCRWLGGVNITVLGGMLVTANVIMKQGRPYIVGFCLPIFTWFLGLPISYHFAQEHGVVGIVAGMCAGYTAAFVTMLFFFVRSDWDKLAELARMRSEALKSAAVKGL